MDSNTLGIFSCAAACSGGIDATGTLRPDVASVWNFDPSNGSLDRSGGAFTFGCDDEKDDEVSPHFG